MQQLWNRQQALALLEKPLLELVQQAASMHAQHFPDGDVQLASLLSIKTGGCPEDCKYCPQSAHYKEANTQKEPLMAVDAVLDAAKLAKTQGASRFCMGAAWRQAPTKGEDFNKVLEMVRGVRGLGMEACVTLGMLSQEQASALKEAGLTAYNHNLDTGEGYYNEIITTRTYQDRLNTLECVRDAGIEVCSGGIIGMGESWADRADMLVTLANLSPQPESVPINVLVPVAGTPLGDNPPVDSLELVRMIAAARIMMPQARVRLSAGRLQLARDTQILCFLAGANSVFYGEKLLTTGNNDCKEDRELFSTLGMAAGMAV
jgi:biotin synthase